MEIGDTVIFIKDFKEHHWDVKEGDEFKIIENDGIRGFGLENKEGVRILETRFMMDYYKLKE